MNIYTRELRANFTSLVVWTTALSMLAAFFLAMYSGFTEDVAIVRDVLGNLPPAITAALDISMSTFFTIYGFFGYLLNFVLLAGAIQAMNVGVGILAKEESGKTADFLLTKPVSRVRIVTAKILAGLTILSITALAFTVTSFVAASTIAPELDYTTFLLLCLTFPIIQLIFFSIGLLASQLVPVVKSVVSLSLPTVFGFFVVGMIGSIIDTEAVRYVSPFKYFDVAYIIDAQSFELRYLAIGLMITLMCTACTYAIFAKKDMRAAS